MKIAIMYDEGEGVPKNLVQAYKWYSLAAANGDKPAP
jgi:TPR repeat protein